jgi:hypothetical protein
MRLVRTNVSLFLSLTLASSLFPQQTSTVQRDPKAVALLQLAIAQMGGSIPNDSVATAKVTIVAGSLTQDGSAKILTHGADQSSEEIITPDSDRTSVYSRDLGAEIIGGVIQPSPLEVAATRQSPSFPLPLLTNILANQDSALLYVGPETIGGLTYQHVRTWNTFASTADRQPLAEFSVRDFWFDSATGLPSKLSFNLRAGRGSPPRQPVEVIYADYRNVGGVLYPFSMHRSLNGTPWMTISIQQVQLNTGLTDANFPVCEAAP